MPIDHVILFIRRSARSTVSTLLFSSSSKRTANSGSPPQRSTAKMMSPRPHAAFLFFLLAAVASLSSAQTVSSWMSKPGNTVFQSQPTAEFGSSGTGWMTIEVDHTQTFQTIDGFGAALSGSSAYLISELPGAKRTELLDELFGTGENSLQLRMVRHTIGSSDFNKVDNPSNPGNEWFTYSDLDTSTACTAQNVDVQVDINAFDQKYLIPMMKKIKKRFRKINFLGSPWSAPAWMKDTKRLNGGKLDPACYQHYANYLLSYLKAFRALRIRIWGITTQNEPLHNDGSYPTMTMDETEQINFVRVLGPTIRNDRTARNTKIIIYDHNWDRSDYPITVMNDNDAKQYIDGSAFHGYAGDVKKQSDVHEAHNDKGIWFTEQTGVHKFPNFDENMRWYMDNMFIGGTRNHAKGVLFWNLALDNNHGPRSGGHCMDCRGVVTISNGDYVRNEEFYTLQHFSKFVQPGATRIFSSQPYFHIHAVAFRNEDKSIVMVALNRAYWSEQEVINIQHCGKVLTYTFPKHAIVTLKWQSDCE